MNEIATLFRRLTSGIYVVGAAHGGRRNAFTAAWLMQVSFDPLLVALSINPSHATYPMLVESGGFAASVLGQGQLDLAHRFGTRSGRHEDKLAGVAWRPGRSGAPILEEAVAFLECEVTDHLPAGDHRLVVARVLGGRVTRPGVSPLTYADTGEMDESGGLYPARF